MNYRMRTHLFAFIPYLLPLQLSVLAQAWGQGFSGNGGALRDFREAIKNVVITDVIPPLLTNVNLVTNAGSTLATSCADIQVKGPVAGAVPAIQKTNDKANVFPGDTKTFTLRLQNYSTATEPLQNGVVYDAFPTISMEYVPNSWTYVGPGTLTSFSISEAGGYTRLVWTLTTPLPVDSQHSFTTRLRSRRPPPPWGHPFLTGQPCLRSFHREKGGKTIKTMN